MRGTSRAIINADHLNVKRNLGPPLHVTDSLRRVFATDSGMLALWEPQRFRGITDYDTWERELLDDADITRHIQEGSFVPFINADEAYDCVIRIGTVNKPASLARMPSRRGIP